MPAVLRVATASDLGNLRQNQEMERGACFALLLEVRVRAIPPGQ
jgi:hypothetical protein